MRGHRWQLRALGWSIETPGGQGYTDTLGSRWGVKGVLIVDGGRSLPEAAQGRRVSCRRLKAALKGCI